MVLFVSLLGYVVGSSGRRLLAILARRRQSRMRPWTDRPEAEFYHRFCRRLESWGLRRGPGQTPAEFAAEMAREYPVLRPGPQLVRVYYDVAFGGRPLSSNQKTWIESFLRGIGQLTREQLQTGE